jgi:hypothetical protein
VLREVQRSIARWIRAPEGVAAALADAEAREGATQRGTERRRLASLVRSDATLVASERLEIYANAYFHRILGVLRDDYPALAARLGDVGFHDLVTSYLLVEPSRHGSLRHVGARLSAFLRAHDAASGVRDRAPWAADLADLEWARVEVFDAPDAPVLERAAVSALAPEAFAGLALRRGPWTRLGEHAHPVDRLWRAALRDDARGPLADGDEDRAGAPSRESIAPERVHVLVWRRREAVLHRRVDADEASALAALAEGTRFDDLCERIAARVGEADAPARIAAWLEQWLADGILHAAAPTSAAEASGAASAELSR